MDIQEIIKMGAGYVMWPVFFYAIRALYIDAAKDKARLTDLIARHNQVTTEINIAMKNLASSISELVRK